MQDWELLIDTNLTIADNQYLSEVTSNTGNLIDPYGLLEIKFNALGTAYIDYVVILANPSELALCVTNQGQIAVHLTALWINEVNINNHSRETLNIEILPRETEKVSIYYANDFSGKVFFKVVTERGNMTSTSYNFPIDI